MTGLPNTTTPVPDALNPKGEVASARSTERKSADLESALSNNRDNIADTLQALQHKLGLDGLAPADISRGLMTGAGFALKTAKKYPKTTVAIGAGTALFLLGRHMASASDDEAETYPDLGGDDWFIVATRLREEAEADLARIEEDIAVHDEKRNQGIPSRGGSARNYRAERDAIRDGLAVDLDAAFRLDLDDLSKDAQTEMASLRAKQYARETEEAGTLSGIADTILDHPLAAGAIALAIGGIVTALRPKGEAEDEDLVREREHLTKTARDLVRQERDNAAKMADLAARELAARRPA